MAVKSAKLTERFRRMAERLLKARLRKDVFSLEFIVRKLSRKGVSVYQNLCQTSPTLYIVQDIEFVGRGAACLVYGCDRCIGGDRYIQNIQMTLDPAKSLADMSLPPFTGVCALQNGGNTNAANRLLLIPDASQIKDKKLKCPFWLSTENIEVRIGSDLLERMNFNV